MDRWWPSFGPGFPNVAVVSLQFVSCVLPVQLNFGSQYLATDVITESDCVVCAWGGSGNKLASPAPLSHNA
jgi:hypothetical protein